MKNEKLGLVLEGGGARGAYQVGACKYLFESGYKFDTFVGTSIGAINASMIAQDEFDKLVSIWENLKYSDVFDIDDSKFNKLKKSSLDMNIIKYLTNKVTSVFKSGGINTEKMRAFGKKCINEEKLRKTNMNFGLATYCISDMKPVEIFIKDIPQGELLDYILASSRLPVFKQELFNDKYYIDGGVYNNCPINMVQKAGKKKFIVIYTNAIGIKKKYIHKKDEEVIQISPKQTLPNILDFDKKSIKMMMNLGYHDAKKVIENLDGFEYYLKSNTEEFYYSLFINYDKKVLKKVYKLLNLEYVDSYKVFLDTVIPTLLKKIDAKNVRTYNEAMCYLLEYVAKKEGIDKYKVYEFKELVELVKKNMKVTKKTKILEVIYTIIKGIDTDNI